MNEVEIETRRLTAAEDFDAIGCMRVARILRQLVPVMQAAPPPPPEPPAAPAKPPSLAARIATGEAPAVTNGHAAP